MAGLASSLERIKQRQMRGLISVSEARRQGSEAAKAYNQALAQAGNLSGTSARMVSKTLTDWSDTLKVVERAGKGAGVSINSVRASMTTLMSNALNTAPGVAQLGSTIGALGLGTPMMIGVLAGVAALGLAWTKITAGANKVKEAAKDAAAQIDALGKTQSQRTQDSIVALNAEIERVREWSKIWASVAAGAASALPGGKGLAGRIRERFDKRAAEEEEAATKRIAKAEADRAETDRKAFLQHAARLNQLQDETNKYNALTAAHGQSAEELELLTLRYDALAQKRFNALTLEGTELKLANQLIDARLRSTAALLEEEIEYRKYIQGLIDGQERLLRRRPAGVTGPSVAGSGMPRGVDVVSDAGVRAKLHLKQYEEMTAAQKELERQAMRLADVMADSFTRIVSGTESVGNAFKRMAQTILSELARIAAQRAFTSFFASLLGHIPGGGGGGSTPTNFGAAPMGAPQSSVIVQQTLNFTATSFDPRTAASLLREQGNEIREIVATGTKQSAAYARRIQRR